MRAQRHPVVNKESAGHASLTGHGAQRPLLAEQLSLLNWKVKVAQSCQTLCDPMDNTVHGVLSARLLEWVAFPSSRRSSQPRDRTKVSHIAGAFFTTLATREAHIEVSIIYSNFSERLLEIDIYSFLQFHGKPLPFEAVSTRVEIGVSFLFGEWGVVDYF